MTTKQEITFVQRVNAVLSKIKRLEKSAENKFAKYDYVPVDDVKDHIRPLLAEAGLVLSVNERSFEFIELKGQKGTTTCAQIKYEITLLSDGGPDDYIEDHITVVLPYTGAQTTGAARSYAVKEWAKATLLVSTGETAADADAHPTEQYGGNSATQSTATPMKPKMSAAQAGETTKRLISQINTCTTSDELDAETKAAGFKRDLNDLSRDWPDYAAMVIAEGKTRRQEIIEAQNSEMFPDNPQAVSRG